MSKHKHEHKYEREHKHRRKHSNHEVIENYETENISQNSLENSAKPSAQNSNESNSSQTPLDEPSEKDLILNEQPKIKSNISKEETSVYKIPVILGEKKFELFLESLIQFDDLVVNINNVKRIVYLTEDAIIPIEDNITPSQNNVTVGKVFLKGFLRSIIEYGAFSSINNNGIKTDIKQIFIDTPFECTTKIAFSIPPIYNNADTYTSINSEPINCELKNSEIFSVNTLCDKTLIDKSFPYIYTFKNIKEKIILTLTLKLIQKQHVNIKNETVNNRV